MEITKAHLFQVAAGLMADEGGPNPEYDRAIAELVATLLGIDDKEAVLTVLLALRQ